MVKVSRDKDGKTRVAKGDKTGLGGQYAPDPQKLETAKNKLEELSGLAGEVKVDLGSNLNKFLNVAPLKVSDDEVKNVLFNKYGAKKMVSGSREMNDGTFLDPYDGETICRCGETVSKYELNNGAHVWSHDVTPSKDVYVDMNGERGSYSYSSYGAETNDDEQILEMVSLNHEVGVSFEAVVKERIDEEGNPVVFKWMSPVEDDNGKHSAYPDNFCSEHGKTFTLTTLNSRASGVKGIFGGKNVEQKLVCVDCENKVIDFERIKLAS